MQHQAPSLSATGFVRTGSTNKLQNTQQHFLTNSMRKAGDLVSQRITSNTNSHQPKLMDKSLKGVLNAGSGNLINLT
jgi:hypothetical protein